MKAVSRVNIIRDTRRIGSDIQTFVVGKQKKFPKSVLKRMSLGQIDQAIRLIKDGKL